MKSTLEPSGPDRSFWSNNASPDPSVFTATSSVKIRLIGRLRDHQLPFIYSFIWQHLFEWLGLSRSPHETNSH